MPTTGRAITDTEKEAVCARLLKAWKECRHQRLGQLIDNALFVSGARADSYYIEDDRLVEVVEKFVRDEA